MGPEEGRLKVRLLAGTDRKLTLCYQCLLGAKKCVEIEKQHHPIVIPQEYRTVE